MPDKNSASRRFYQFIITTTEISEVYITSLLDVCGAYEMHDGGS